VRTRLKRRLSLGAALLAGAVLAGCGSTGIPTDASLKDFCKAGERFSSVTKFDDGVKAADKLHDTGTPKGIPADARAGFELVVRMVTRAKDQTDLEASYNKLTENQKTSVNALDTYLTKSC
jgi:hypothetical protein